MSRRKPLAALAAVTAAVAIAVPAASASAATTERADSPLPFTPPTDLCQTLSGATQAVLALGDPQLVDLTQTAVDVLGCGAAAL
jgi:hypothetical protein